MTSPRPRWPIGTLALIGLCVAGMLVGVVLALNPPDGDRDGSKRVREFPAPPQSISVPPPPAIAPRDDHVPRSSGPPAPPGNDPAGPRSR
jgi:hypothetical protein